MKTHSLKSKILWCSLVFLTLVVFGFTVGCSKRPNNAKEVFEANLDATGGKENWDKLEAVVETAEILVEINERKVSNTNSVLKVEIPKFKKLETYSGNRLSRIELIRPEEAYYISFDNGKFIGIREIEKEQVQIKPELKLLEEFENWNLEMVSWNGKEVYQLKNSDTGEKLIYDREAFKRLAKIDDTPYGEATTYYTNYKTINGLDLPYKERQSIPSAKYEIIKKVKDVELNKEFLPGEFDLNDNWVSLKVGDRVPAYEIESLEEGEEKISRENLLGNVVLIDFWATWCKPCIKEFPNLKKQYEKYKDQGFEIVSISLDENEVALDKFMKNNTLPWKNAHLEDGFKSDMVRSFHIAVIPKPILMDRDGTILAMDMEASGENLNRKLSELLGKGTK